MPQYISSDGSIKSQKSFFRQVNDFFWSIINIIFIFFSTFFYPNKKITKIYNKNENNSNVSGSGGGRGLGRGNMRGMDSLRNRGGDCATGGG